MENKLITYPDKDMPNLVRIKYKKGGQTPKELEGLYTGFTMAKKAIDFYNKLKPVHEALEYAHQKKISDEEEAKLFDKVEKEVAEQNKVLEAKKNGKEEKPKIKDEGGAKHIRKGPDNGGISANVS